MLVAIGMFIPRLFGLTLSQRAARVVAVVLIVVAAGVAFQVAKYAYDRSVINRYQTEQTAARKQRDEKAAQEATQKEAERLADLERQNSDLEAAATEAAEREPEKARATVGPVTKSYYDTLRKRKK